MKHTREQKRATLLAEAQVIIEEFLDWEEQAEQPKLTAIEDEVLELRERFGQRLAEVSLADQDAKQPVARRHARVVGRRCGIRGRRS